LTWSPGLGGAVTKTHFGYEISSDIAAKSRFREDDSAVCVAGSGPGVENALAATPDASGGREVGEPTNAADG